MDQKELIARKLILEIKKAGRECLYDMSSAFYKNNHHKQAIWKEIAGEIGIDRNECQILWKALRRRHKVALNKNAGRSVSERVEVKGFSKILIKEMDYFLSFWEDKEASMIKYEDSNTLSFRRLCGETARDVESNFVEFATDNSSLHLDNSFTPMRVPKRAKLDDLEAEYKESMKTLNSMAEAVMVVSAEKIDPFFVAMDSEFSKVPEDRKGPLKLKLMSLIIGQQR